MMQMFLLNPASCSADVLIIIYTFHCHFNATLMIFFMAADIHEVYLLVMHLFFSLSLSPYLDGVCLSSEVTSSSQEARRTRKRYFFTLLLNFVFPL